MFPLIAVSILVGVGAQDITRALDLTRPPETASPSIPPSNILSCGVMGRGGGRSVGAPPFALTVESFDRPEYSMGGRITVDLKLTNLSHKSLPIPTVPVDHFYERFEGGEAIQFGFMILIKDANGKEHELTGAALRGSTKFTNTVQSLAPLESITIHFPGHIPVVDDPSLSTLEGSLLASLLVTDGECRMWDVVRSKAVGKATLRRD
jgi:hypothetical protein